MREIGERKRKINQTTIDHPLSHRKQKRNQNYNVGNETNKFLNHMRANSINSFCLCFVTFASFVLFPRRN